MRMSTTCKRWVLSVCAAIAITLGPAATNSAAAQERASQSAAEPARVCGSAWARLGYQDGQAGREPRDHPFGDPSRAAETCRETGRAAPDLAGYRAQFGAARYLSSAASPLSGQLGARRSRAASGVDTSPSAALAAASPGRADQAEIQRLSVPGADEARRRQALANEARDLRLQLNRRPGDARAGRIGRLAAEGADAGRGLSRPGLRPAERRAAERRLLGLDRQLRQLDAHRRNSPRR